MFSRKLDELSQQNLIRLIRDRSSRQGPRIFFDGREYINFSSNDYLGLASHPEIIGAAVNAIKKFGFGSGASRLLSGGSILHKTLEEKVALFKGTESALIFNSGCAANTGVIPAIAGYGDIIFSDELNHASIVDGCRLSRARTVVYKHGDIADLGKLFKEYSVMSGHKCIIVTDTVFSMDGDIAPLKEIYNLCFTLNSELPDSVLLYLDDAHGTGVLGNGKGALSHFNIMPEPWIVQMGTFSKALGSLGAFVAGSKDIIDWLSNTARSFIFSTALPACVVAASAKAIELIEEQPDLIAKLWKNRNRLFTLLREAGYDLGESVTPIIPLKTNRTEDALRLSQYLYEKGIYAPAIRPPTVKEPRVRVTVTAAHSEEDIKALADALSSALV